MNETKVPEYAARIETPEEIGQRYEEGQTEAMAGLLSLCAAGAVRVDRDQIRRALTLATRPPFTDGGGVRHGRDVDVAAVFAVLDQIGGAL